MSQERPRWYEKLLRKDTYRITENPLTRVIKEYKTQPHTPELVTATWDRVWQVWGERIDSKFAVPPLDRTPEELEAIEQSGNMMVYVPEKQASHENRHLFGKIFPRMLDERGEKVIARVINKHNQGGWYDIETRLASLVYSTEETLAKKLLIPELLKSQKRAGQRLGTYIIGSQFSKEVTGYYFDENSTEWSKATGYDPDKYHLSSWSSLGGSYILDGGKDCYDRPTGSTIGARFFPDGRLAVESYSFVRPTGGGGWDTRTEGEKF